MIDLEKLHRIANSKAPIMSMGEDGFKELIQCIEDAKEIITDKKWLSTYFEVKDE